MTSIFESFQSDKLFTVMFCSLMPPSICASSIRNPMSFWFYFDFQFIVVTLVGNYMAFISVVC